MEGEWRLDLLPVDEKRKTGGGGDGNREKEWSDLPEDIISLILERLTVVDRIRFSAICKTWLWGSAHYIHRKLPSIMEYSYTSLKPPLCVLYEPCYDGRKKMTPFIVNDQRAADLFSDDATLIGSVSGWIIWSKTVYEGFKITYFYVYNPLSKIIISPPKFKWQRYHRQKDVDVKYATFTSVPTSPDCVFMLIFAGRRNDVFLSSYSNGDTKWNIRDITPPSDEYFCYGCLMTCMKGMLYCFGKMGSLSSFNVATQEWNILSKPWTLSLNRPYFLACFLGYGGDLYLVDSFDSSDDGNEAFYRISNSCCSDSYCSKCKVYKFDWLDEKWKKVESLEGGIIFLNPCPTRSGCGFGMSREELGKQVEQIKIPANRVYYFNWSLVPRFHACGPQENGSLCDVIYRDNLLSWDPKLWIDNRIR